jgi:hypothetical protein
MSYGYSGGSYSGGGYSYSGPSSYTSASYSYTPANAYGTQTAGYYGQTPTYTPSGGYYDSSGAYHYADGSLGATITPGGGYYDSSGGYHYADGSTPVYGQSPLDRTVSALGPGGGSSGGGPSGGGSGGGPSGGGSSGGGSGMKPPSQQPRVLPISYQPVRRGRTIQSLVTPVYKYPVLPASRSGLPGGNTGAIYNPVLQGYGYTPGGAGVASYAPSTGSAVPLLGTGGYSNPSTYNPPSILPYLLLGGAAFAAFKILK